MMAVCGPAMVGFEVETASRGEEALELLKGKRCVPSGGGETPDYHCLRALILWGLNKYGQARQIIQPATPVALPIVDLTAREGQQARPFR